MKKPSFSEEQIIAILSGQESGMKTADVCRKHGMSSVTLYAWKAKYGGMNCNRLCPRPKGAGTAPAGGTAPEL